MRERFYGVAVRNRIGALQPPSVEWKKARAAIRPRGERPILLQSNIAKSRGTVAPIILADSISTRSPPKKATVRSKGDSGLASALAAPETCGSVLWQSAVSFGKSTYNFKPRNFTVSRKAPRE